MGGCTEPEAPWTKCYSCHKLLKTCEDPTGGESGFNYVCPEHPDGVETDAGWICNACADKHDKQELQEDINLIDRMLITVEASVNNISDTNVKASFKSLIDCIILLKKNLYESNN